MSKLLKTVGTMAGIKRVVWVDDLFITNVDLLVDMIIPKIPALLNAGYQLEHSALLGKNWNANASTPVFAQQVSAIVAGNRALAVDILEGLTAQQKRDDPEIPSIPPDLTTAQIDIIRGAFENVDTFTFGTWQQNKSTLMDSADDSTLFLIDQDFSYEIAGAKEKGLAIMKELLGRPKTQGTFILLSHAFKKENELVDRDSFSDSNNCNAGFAFVSKERLTCNADNAEEQDKELASALQDALVRSWCHRTAEAAKGVVTRAVEDAHRKMLNQTFDDLGGGIFHLSQRDGVPETETVARIFMLAGRTELQDEMAKPSPLQERLVTIRKITKAINYDPPRGKILSPILKAWRNREIWDPALIVNSGFSQPSCGDVFVTMEGSKSRTFILLGQPCNLAVRSSGFRHDQEALFAECIAEETATSYKLEWNGEVHFVLFNQVFPVNLLVLDAVASNAEGYVKLEVKKQLPIQLLLGMESRLKKMIGSLTAALSPKVELPFKYQTFSVSEKLKYPVIFSKADGVYSLSLQRIGRVRAPYADAVYGALANHHTRMAFDFDFSRIPER